MRSLVCLLFLAACAPPKVPPKTPPGDPTPQWQRLAATDARVSFEALVGQPAQRSREQSSEVIFANTEHFSSTVYVGKGLTLGSWTEHNSSPGTVTPGHVTICNEPAETAIRTRAAESVEVHEPGNHWVASPAATTVTRAFTHAGVGVIARWHVEDAYRAQLRGAEERFFASFRCD